MYTKGFFFGLPIEDFQWGLLWRSQYPPRRRLGFPTWSWAGWEGGLWPAYSFDFTKPHEYPLHIRIWRAAECGDLASVFMSQHREIYKRDPVAKAAVRGPEGLEFDSSKYPNAEKDGYLFIEAIMLRLSPDYSRPLEYLPQSGQYAMFVFALGGVRCYLRIMSVDAELDGHGDFEKQDFILLARDHTDGLIFHSLLLVSLDGDVARRRTVLELIVPVSRLSVLQECEPVKRRVVLI